jgi:4,5-DOPA dioxygenase extradiol
MGGLQQASLRRPGAGHDGPALRVHDSLTYGCLGMDAYAFGAGTSAVAAALAGSD